MPSGHFFRAEALLEAYKAARACEMPSGSCAFAFAKRSLQQLGMHDASALHIPAGGRSFKDSPIVEILVPAPLPHIRHVLAQKLIEGLAATEP